MIIEILWIALFGASIVPFGLYLIYMGKVAKNRDWGIKFDTKYEPTISIVIPTYEEERNIETKLDNLMTVDYPKDKIQLIVVDSASTDGTVKRAQEWATKHPEVQTLVIRQAERKGMVNALIEALKSATGEIFLKTDVDCMLYPDSIRTALKYLSDPTVGSVAGLHHIVSKKDTIPAKAEKTYREFYKVLRIGESKLYGTVLYEGELMLVKRRLLEEISFDEEVGGDDVATALKLASIGYRAITSEDSFFIEKTPFTWKERVNQKTRRARHVFQAIWKYKYLINQKNTKFHRLILPFEMYIYVFNPFLVFALLVVSVPLLVIYPLIIIVFALLLLLKPFREMFITFVSNNLIMLSAIVLESRKRESMTWNKIGEIRN